MNLLVMNTEIQNTLDLLQGEYVNFQQALVELLDLKRQKPKKLLLNDLNSLVERLQEELKLYYSIEDALKLMSKSKRQILNIINHSNIGISKKELRPIADMVREFTSEFAKLKIVVDLCIRNINLQFDLAAEKDIEELKKEIEEEEIICAEGFKKFTKIEKGVFGAESKILSAAEDNPDAKKVMIRIKKWLKNNNNDIGKLNRMLASEEGFTNFGFGVGLSGLILGVIAVVVIIMKGKDYAWLNFKALGEPLDRALNVGAHLIGVIVDFFWMVVSLAQSMFGLLIIALGLLVYAGINQLRHPGETTF